MLTVTKFGGSSLSGAKQFNMVKDIVFSNKTRKVVVVSALGKRFNEDTKITDLLYLLHAHIVYNADFIDIWEKITTRFIELRDELNINCDIEKYLNEIYEQLNNQISLEYLISRGEFLTAKLMSAYLGFKFVDSLDIIKYNNNSTLNEELTNLNINKYIQADEYVVVPGFYGSYEDNKIKLLSRGGSDVSASIIALYLNATLYENWTDVSGVMLADPRIIKNPKIVNSLTYNELRELSYMGASVLHEETIFHVAKKNIPIRLLNTFEPQAMGTIISNVSSETSIISGIAGKKGFVPYTIFNKNLSSEIGYLRRVLSIFEKYNVNVDHAPTGIDNVSILVSETQVRSVKNQILREIEDTLSPDKIVVGQTMALIAVVGNNMKGISGLSGKIFSTLGKNDINIKMINQGPDELNIIIGVLNEQFDLTINSLYNELSTVV